MSACWEGLLGSSKFKYMGMNNCKERDDGEAEKRFSSSSSSNDVVSKTYYTNETEREREERTWEKRVLYSLKTE